MRIGSLLALIVAVLAVALSATAALAGPGPAYRGSAPTTVTAAGHPMQLARVGLLTTYHWAQPGCAPVVTLHAQPW